MRRQALIRGLPVMLALGISALPAASAVDSAPELVEIPAGLFVMGANPNRDPLAFDNESWPTTGEGHVALPTFYLSRHEVTVAQFAEFVRATGATVDARAVQGPANHPVTFVSWPDALAYCRWMTKNLQRAASTAPNIRVLLQAGWRITLPTEAEWEKAARGTDGRRFPWGTELIARRANFAAQGTAPVGQFACPECAHGLADMSGNVWEWTSSPYQPYPYNPGDDRANLEADALWVIRGGGYADDARLIRTTTRTGADPGARRPFLGFRVALSQPPQKTR